MRYRFSLLLLLALAPFLRAEEPNLNDLSAANALGGPEILDIIKHAQTVTVQRVDSKLAEDRAHAQEHPKLIILGKPFDAPAAEAEALQAAFCAGSTYLSPSKVCQFRANVRYGFVVTPERKVEIVLCFGCGEMEVWRGGQMVSFGPFDGGYGRILDITKKLFPNDEFLARFNEETFKERTAKMRAAPPGSNAQ